MRPYYFCSGFRDIALEDVLNSTPWIQVTDARLECFMSGTTGTYTYGEGRGVRTYTPVPYSSLVLDIQRQLNRDDIGGLDGALRDMLKYNVCFLNRYDNAALQLGCHSDDSPGMDHEHPIAVVSFGQPREIWWREGGADRRHPRRSAAAPRARLHLRDARWHAAYPPAPHPEGRQADVDAGLVNAGLAHLSALHPWGYQGQFLRRRGAAARALALDAVAGGFKVSSFKKALQDVGNAVAAAKIRAMWPRAENDGIAVPLIDSISFTQLAQLSAALGTAEIYVDVAPGDPDNETVPGHDHAVLTIWWPQGKQEGRS